MGRILAVSDIHGQYAMLVALLDKLQLQPSDHIVFMGDYVDRGPKSKQVLETVIAMQDQHRATLLMGNHEAIMLRAFTATHTKPWHHWIDVCGGVETLQSYNLRVEDFNTEQLPLLHQLPSDHILRHHLQAIERMHYYKAFDDVIFVHAGVDPRLPIEETPIATLLWIRDDFHKGYQGTKTIVFGHTPTYRLHQDKTNTTVYQGTNNIIGIDGGAVFGGQLHALDWTNKKIYSIHAKSCVA